MIHAIRAVVDGDEAALAEILRADPTIVNARSDMNATLLHWVGANGLEPQRSPPNAPRIARMLLEAGAEVDAVADVYGGATTLGLVVTSIHPHLAGVQVGLVDVLLDFGAAIEGVAGDGSPLGAAILFGYTAAAERLAERGARWDNLVYAAGLGRVDAAMLASPGVVTRRTDDRVGRYSFPIPRDADVREVALTVAAMHGRVATVELLLAAGVDPHTRALELTPLEYARQLGQPEVARALGVRHLSI